MIDLFLSFLPFFIPILLFGPFFTSIPNIIAAIVFSIYKSVYKSEYKYANRREFWREPLTLMAKVFQILGRIFHGYEIDGLEKIPDHGAAIIVMYHAEHAVDAALFNTEIYLRKKRHIIQIVHRLAFRIPGFSALIEACEWMAGTIESCVAVVNRGDLLTVFPGGATEAFLSDNKYQVIWPKAAGFAKIAVQSKVPVIPVFTTNTREVMARWTWFKQFFINLYIKKKILIVPIYGWYPVKLKSYVGDPIYYDPERSVEELVQLSKTAVEDLMQKHQRIPGSFYAGIMERFDEDTNRCCKCKCKIS